MDSLTMFGLISVTAMLVTYACEKWSAWFILAFRALAYSDLVLRISVC